MAKFIGMAGLSSIAIDQPVHMTVENGDLQPLWIDACDFEGDRHITIAQYNEPGDRDQQINALIRFSISKERLLSLEATAFHVADTDKVVANTQDGDRHLAALQIRSLRRQEFDKAILSELQASGPQSREPINAYFEQAAESVVSAVNKEDAQPDATEEKDRKSVV